MHQRYTELSQALVQACRVLIEQYGTPNSVSSPFTSLTAVKQGYHISGPRLELRSHGSEWQRLDPCASDGEWHPAQPEDLQEGEHIVAELAVLAANGAWLQKADGSIRRLKAIVRALEVGGP